MAAIDRVILSEVNAPYGYVITPSAFRVWKSSARKLIQWAVQAYTALSHAVTHNGHRHVD